MTTTLGNKTIINDGFHLSIKQLQLIIFVLMAGLGIQNRHFVICKPLVTMHKAILNLLILTILSGHIFFLTSCSADLPDYYTVYPNSPAISGKNVLICKLGCTTDPIIDNIKSIQWSDNLMYIMQKGSADNYYIIKAKGERLTCCNGDTLIGPLTRAQFNETLKKLELPKQLIHDKTY